jgi:drug/metabolite transporter (DMT)-like permease
MAMHLWAVAHAEHARARPSAGSDTVGYGAGLLTWMIAGSVFVAVKLVADEMPPWTMCFFRALLSCLVLVPFVAGEHGAMLAFLRRRWREAAVIGAIGLGLTQGTMFTALHHTSAVNAGIVFATAPMLTMVLARVVLHEPMNGWQVLGSLVAFGGIVLISVHGSVARLAAFDFNGGDLIALGAAMMFATYTVLLKRAKFDLPRMAMMTILLGFGSLAALPFFVWEYLGGQHADLGRDGYLALAYCAVAGGAVMYLLYSLSVEILGASRAGTLVYTQMIFVAIFAWAILGETIAWYHYAGASLVVAGVLVVTLVRPKPPAPAAT